MEFNQRKIFINFIELLYTILLKKKIFLGYLGLEPRTDRLKAEYSTIELATLLYINMKRYKH